MWRSGRRLRTTTEGLSTSITAIRRHWRRNSYRWSGWAPLSALLHYVNSDRCFNWFFIVSVAHPCRRGRRKNEILRSVYTWSHGSKWRWDHWCYYWRSGRGFIVLVRYISLFILHINSSASIPGVSCLFCIVSSGFRQLDTSHWDQRLPNDISFKTLQASTHEVVNHQPTSLFNFPDLLPQFQLAEAQLSCVKTPSPKWLKVEMGFGSRQLFFLDVWLRFIKCSVWIERAEAKWYASVPPSLLWDGWCTRKLLTHTRITPVTATNTPSRSCYFRFGFYQVKRRCRASCQHDFRSCENQSAAVSVPMWTRWTHNRVRDNRVVFHLQYQIKGGPWRQCGWATNTNTHH